MRKSVLFAVAVVAVFFLGNVNVFANEIGCLDDFECDDGNPCTLNWCAPFPNGDASVQVVGGQCVTELKDSGTPCGDSTEGECDNPDTCDGAGSCVDNFKEPGTACQDGNMCTSSLGAPQTPDSCVGGGICVGVPVNCPEDWVCNTTTGECGSAVNHPPVCDANGPYIAECGSPSNQTIQLDATGSSDPDGDPLSYQWSANGGGTFNDATSPTPNFTPIAPAGDSVTVALTVDDGYGAEASCEATVSVVDTTPPVISCPADITVLASSSFGEDVIYTVPSASDTCETSVDVTCDPAPGQFPIETTNVTCTATDDAGNTSSCSFDVEVLPPLCEPDPMTQGYWHRQCLGLPADEGGIDPGRNGRGPSKKHEFAFESKLMPCAEIWLEELGLIGEETCTGLDADPPSDACERAIRQLTALLLNICSDRLSVGCELDLSCSSCTALTVGELLDELSFFITSGDPHNCKLAAECAALANEGEGLAVPGVQLNEIRINQPNTDYDEYFELIGPAGTSLNGLTYLVIGDGAGGSGVIEAIIDLSGQSIPLSGFFVGAEGTFTLGTEDLTTNLEFENSDNVTHMLVSDFFGTILDDLDTNDDGVLDITPWSDIVDCVALIEEIPPPVATEEIYCSTTVGPDGPFVPGHAYLCPSGWIIGLFDPAGGEDTPGAANICESFEACCNPDGTCAETTPAYCSATGGTSQGTGTECSDVTCPQPALEACCFPGTSCLELIPGECSAQGGVSQGPATTCSGVTCQNYQQEDERCGYDFGGNYYGECEPGLECVQVGEHESVCM